MEDGDELTYDSSAYEMYHAVSDLFPLNACSRMTVWLLQETVTV